MSGDFFEELQLDDENVLSFGDEFLESVHTLQVQVHNNADRFSYFSSDVFPESTTPTATSPLFSPSTPSPHEQVSSQSRAARSSNPLPRHKRPSHINAEHRRRNKIQKCFDTLKELVPSLSEENSGTPKDSKCVMLHKTSCHLRKMTSDMVTQEQEMDALRKEIADLNAEIQCFQAQLPVSGMAAVDKPSCHIGTMYKNYLKSRTRENWKFWLFSFIVNPLFESYNRMVTTCTHSTFLQNVREWAHEQLSLVNLRPCILSALRQISLKSSILTDSAKLPEEALQKITES